VLKPATVWHLHRSRVFRGNLYHRVCRLVVTAFRLSQRRNSLCRNSFPSIPARP
jgi:hypothetical protein